MKYFVCSNGDSPDALYFSLETAVAGDHQFIDVFDDQGNSLGGIERQADGSYPEVVYDENG